MCRNPLCGLSRIGQSTRTGRQVFTYAINAVSSHDSGGCGQASAAEAVAFRAQPEAAAGLEPALATAPPSAPVRAARATSRIADTCCGAADLHPGKAAACTPVERAA